MGPCEVEEAASVLLGLTRLGPCEYFAGSIGECGACRAFAEIGHDKGCREAMAEHLVADALGFAAAYGARAASAAWESARGRAV